MQASLLADAQRPLCPHHANPSDLSDEECKVVNTTPVGGPERGYNGAKRLSGRKSHILVDTGALVLDAMIHSADLPDRDGG